MGISRRMAGVCAALACTIGLAAIPAASARPGARGPRTAAAGTCRLGNGDGRVKHVIYLQFDNVHLRRDNPNVPSDLEQMPHLLNFLQGNGTVLNKQYTILISHTAGGYSARSPGCIPIGWGSPSRTPTTTTSRPPTR